jgi:hypothetical protein
MGYAMSDAQVEPHAGAAVNEEYAREESEDRFRRDDISIGDIIFLQDGRVFEATATYVDGAAGYILSPTCYQQHVEFIELNDGYLLENLPNSMRMPEGTSRCEVCRLAGVCIRPERCDVENNMHH